MLESLDKLPTEENLDSVAFADILGRNKFIENFIRLLASIKGHYSIAFDGRWGSGKTFFVKQTERIIRQLFRYKEEFNEYYEIESNPNLCQKFQELFDDDEIKAHPMMTFYYDAWQHDNHQNALLSLVFELIKMISSMNPQFKIKPTYWDNLRNTIVPIVQGVMNQFTGIDLEKFNYNVNEILQHVQEEDDLDKLLKKFFETLLPNENIRLVIFIDELDRCKPDYAVQLLEHIKHYIVSDRITFVFSVNFEQLQHTIKHYYGNDFEASMYLDKFFDLHIPLPRPDINGKRSTFHFSREYTFNTYCHYIIEEFNFEIREILHFRELINNCIVYNDDFFHCFSINIDNPDSIIYHVKTKEILDCYDSKQDSLAKFIFLIRYFAPLALALYIKDINDYYDFIDGRNKYAIDVINKYIEIGFIEIGEMNYICKMFNIESKRIPVKNVRMIIKKKAYQLYKAVFAKNSLKINNINLKNNLYSYKIKELFLYHISVIFDPSVIDKLNEKYNPEIISNQSLRFHHY